MHISFCFAASHGDFPASDEDLAKPLLAGATDPGSCLTLLDYFNAVRDFLVESDGTRLRSALRGSIGREIAPGDIQGLAIHSAKMGMFYHVARVDVSLAGTPRRLAVSTATNREGRDCLARDYGNIRELLDLRPRPDLLPEPFALDRGGPPAFLHLLAEWLEDFHEWHLSEGDDGRGFVLWDWGRGFRHLPPGEGGAIIREAARILALSFDQESGRHIRAWHHAAGDFIARVDASGVAVRLTTVRDYALFPGLPEYHPALALLLHLLESSVLLRLDKLDGVGETAWLDGLAVQATVEGFFQGLSGIPPAFSSAGEFLAFARAFSPSEMAPFLGLVMNRLKEETPSDFIVAAPRAEEHLAELHQALQDFNHHLL